MSYYKTPTVSAEDMAAALQAEEERESQRSLTNTVDRAIALNDRDSLFDAIQQVEDEGGPDDVPLDAALTNALWKLTRREKDLSWLDEAWLLYRLQQEVEADVLLSSGEMHRASVARWMTWESMLAQKAASNPHYEWNYFCESRLGIGTNTASARKRVWEVFVVIYGWPRSDLLIAGSAKLQQAASYAEKCWNKQGKIDHTLERLLRGDPHTCSECFGYVDYDDEKPGACPECGNSPYAGIEPGSFGQVRAYIKEAQDMAKERDDEVMFDFALTEGNDEGRQLARSGPYLTISQT
jgi:hypothetical protein